MSFISFCLHIQIFGNRIISFAHSILLIHFETVTLRYCFNWSEKQRNNDKYIEIRKCSPAYDIYIAI